MIIWFRFEFTYDMFISHLATLGRLRTAEPWLSERMKTSKARWNRIEFERARMWFIVDLNTSCCFRNPLIFIASFWFSFSFRPFSVSSAYSSRLLWRATPTTTSPAHTLSIFVRWTPVYLLCTSKRGVEPIKRKLTATKTSVKLFRILTIIRRETYLKSIRIQLSS